MALINFVQLADALDYDGVAVQEVWQAEDDTTGELVLMYFDIGTSSTDAQNQMGNADVSTSPPPDPIEATEPKWQYNTDTKEYCVFGDDGLKLFAIKRDASGNTVITPYDTAGNPVVPGWIDLVRQDSNQQYLYTGTDVLMTKIAGSLAYDGATGIVSLKATKIYRLFATFAFFSIESSDTVAIEWVKTDNSPVGAVHQTRLRPANASSNGSNANTIEVVYQPVVDEGVKLRCTEYSHATDGVIMYKDRSIATIVEITN